MFLWVVFSYSVFATICLDNPQYTLSDVKSQQDVTFGVAFNALTNSNQTLLMDTFQPKITTQKMPCVVLVHGGNCAGGDKSSFHSWGQTFAQRGFFAVSINYRLQSTLASCRSPGSIEAAGNDAKASVRFLRGKAAEWNIDESRIMMMGCSAGARTTLWAGFTQGNGVGGEGVSQAYPQYSSHTRALIPVSGDLYAPTESACAH